MNPENRLHTAFVSLTTLLALAACGGGGGGSGGGGNNPPGAAAGFVVASRTVPAEINIYRADQPNVPIETIAGATFTGPMNDAAGNRLGMVYGKLAAPDIYFELGVFLQSQRVILAAEPGHSYRLLYDVNDNAGLIDAPTRRVVFLDTVGTSVGVRTATLDGVESHLVKSNCITVTRAFFSVAGVVFLCEAPAGVKKVYYSDGVAPAVYLTGSDLRIPLALTATHSITGDVNPLRQIHSQSLAGALSGSVQPDRDIYTSVTTMNNGEDTLLAVNPQGIVLGRTFNAAEALPYELWTVNADLSVNDGNPSTRFRSFGPPFRVELSPDGAKAAVIYQFMAGAGAPHKGAVISLALPNFGDINNPALNNPLFLIPFPATESINDVHFLSGGKFAGTWGSTSLNIHNADGTLFSGISALPSSTFVATKDNYLLYAGVVGSTRVFNSSLFDATADLTLSSSAQQPRPTLRSDGYVTFVDDSNFPWIASADPSIPAALRLKQKIDDVPATSFVLSAGDGSGNRVFLTLIRTNGDQDVVMFDLDDRTTTPIASGIGFFFPN